MATQKQREFIAQLAAERTMTDEQRLRLNRTMAVGVEYDKASSIIEWLLRQPYAPGHEPVDLADVPAGRYAVDDLLVRIDKPEAGRWAGFVFVKNGSEYRDEERFGLQAPDSDGYRGQHMAALRAIADDPEAAMRAYGLKTGSCGVCGRTLEDPESVERGIGPVCYSKLGVAA